MARITLPLDRRTRLPRLCMVCGSDDCDFKQVTIRPSVGAGGMVAMANREGYSTLTLSLPLCDQRRKHFALQTVLRYLAIAAVIAVSLFGLILLAIVNKGWVVGVMVVAILAVVATWFIVSMNVNKTRVHLSGYTGDTAVFSNVASQFARAFEEEGGETDEERPARPSRKPARRKEAEADEEGGDFNFR